MVSSPGPCALSRGRSPEPFFLVFRLEYEVAKACKSCIFLEELSNEYALANFCVDTAENGLLKVCQQFSREEKQLEIP